MPSDLEKKQEKEYGEIREKKIQDIQDNTPIQNQYKVPYRGKLKEFPVYQIPLTDLIYNKYNGRILSETRAIESLGTKILAHTKEGDAILDKLLWDSKLDANKTTLESLRNLGQDKIAVISKDGVVIDGNRRTMLLNRLPSVDHLEAVILPLSSYNDWLEIENIETQIQMGGDKAVDYDPIQIYLKIQSMYNQMDTANKTELDNNDDDVMFIPKFDKNNINKKAVDKIYENIGSYKTIQSEKDVAFFLAVMDVMDEYLHNLKISHAYPALEGKENQFRLLTRSLSSFYGEKSIRVFGEEYTDLDVDDFKYLAFDLIRLKQENSNFKLVGSMKTGDGQIIGNKELWQEFYDNHQKIIERFSEEGFDGNTNPSKIGDVLASRDSDFKDQVEEDVLDNFDKSIKDLRHKQLGDKPAKLVGEATDAIKAIKVGHPSVQSREVQNGAIKLVTEGLKIIGDKSYLFVLNQTISWLNKINDSNSDAMNNIDSSNKDEVLKSLTEIQKLSYQASKLIKKI